MGEAQISDKRRILIVDDEPGVLHAVRRELSTRPLGRHRYEIEIFNDPRAALERARVQAFEVAVSDYRMPEMTGLDFLKALAEIQDDCVRIVLSGQTDFDALLQMLDQTPVYRFIPKPWNSSFLKSSIAQAVDFRDAYLENRRLADALGQRGVALPPAGREVDRILVVAGAGVADLVLRTLRQRSRLDDGYRALPDAAGGDAPGRVLAGVAIEAADSAAAALEQVERLGCSCAVVDGGAPGVEGTQFLSRLAAAQPDCAAILLAFADHPEHAAALVLPRIHAVVTAPWADFELRAAVVHALTQRRLMLEHRAMTLLWRSDDPGIIC